MPVTNSVEFMVASPGGAGGGPPENPASGETASGEKRRILVAEDSIDQRQLLSTYLKDSSYALIEVEDGTAAVAAFLRTRPDLILMDVQMPILDGYGATEQIRRLEKQNGWMPVPILALTANARLEDVAQSLARGCNGHVNKPVRKLALLEAISRHLGPRAELLEPPSADEELMRSRLSDLMPKYIANQRREVQTILDALASNDFQKVAQVAHRMKGSGGIFGLQRVTDLGRTIEQAAQSKDAVAVESAVRTLLEFLAALPPLTS